MPKNTTVSARIDEKLKARAEKVMRQLGISTTDVITMLYHQIVLRQGIPFDVKVPNAETRRAMRELEAGKGEVFEGSAAELIEHVLGRRKDRKS